MITIAMTQGVGWQCMWSINPEVFSIIRRANENWPGVIAYRLTGQEKYYEPTWVPDDIKVLHAEQLGEYIQSTNDIEPLSAEVFDVTEVAEDAVPSTERVEEGNAAVCKKSLTFIDLKTKG